MRRKWWKEAVIYQIYPRSFNDSNGDGIGDIPGIINKLDYLKELGIDTVWLSPVYKSPNDDNGYDISDYRDIMDEFGSLSDMEELIREIHIRNMKIIIDMVVNHTSDEHHWFKESRSAKDSPYRDYYIWRPGKNGSPPNNWGSWFGGSAWEYDEKTGEYYLHLFSRKQADLNWRNPQLRKRIYKMMNWWLNKGIDGFRLDVINLISKAEGLPDGVINDGDKYGDGTPYYLNGPRIHDYLQEMNESVFAGDKIMTVGETPGITPEEGKLYVNYNRSELDMVFHSELMDIDSGKTKWERKNWHLSDFKEIINKWYLALQDKGWNSIFFNNHDQPRVVSRFGDDKKYRRESAKMLATLLFTLPGTPFMFQGEEIGMTNVTFDSIEEYRDLETLNWYREKLEEGYVEDEVLKTIYRVSRDNSRTPMQWDKTEHAGFTTAVPWIKVNPNYKKINVEDSKNNPDSVFNYYKKLINLRKREENLALVYGEYKPVLAESERIYSYIRTLAESKMLIILNYCEEETNYSCELINDDSKLLLSNYPALFGENKIYLRPYEARIYRL